MNGARGRWLVGEGIAAVLRYGTVVAIAFVGTGYLIALVGGAARTGPVPATALIADGGPSALVAIGLLGLTLIPVLMLCTAAVGLVLLRERRMAIASLVVILILLGALATALVVALAG